MHAMRKCGWLVHDTSSQGNGFPDLVCARNGVVVLVEIKFARGKLTSDQVAFIDNGWPVTIVRTVDDVIALTEANAA
jgi:hypothetical protein